MTSTEIAEKLSCIPEKDIELLTGMMLAAKSGDDRRLLRCHLLRCRSGGRRHTLRHGPHGG